MPRGIHYKYFLSYYDFIKKGGRISFQYVFPVLSFKNEDTQTGGGHYFYQDIWALRILSKIKPNLHYDIGSRYDGFTGQATVITEVISVELRPPNFELENFKYIHGDVLSLPLPSSSVHSISSLHTLEHIGLGRYGDEINPNGFIQALLELQRVLAIDGHLLISFPVGKYRVEFNAQRVIDPLEPLRILNELNLVNFSVVDDEGLFHYNAKPTDYLDKKYCCGMYHFYKPALKKFI